MRSNNALQPTAMSPLRRSTLLFGLLLALSPALSAERTANDYEVVPGKRVGPIVLGMLEQDVVRLFGTPERVGTFDSERVYRYDAEPNSWISFDSRTKTAIAIMPVSTHYRIAGRSVWGDKTETGLIARLGKPDHVIRYEGNKEHYLLCYDRGLSARVVRGIVNMIHVIPPRTCKSGGR